MYVSRNFCIVIEQAFLMISYCFQIQDVEDQYCPMPEDIPRSPGHSANYQSSRRTDDIWRQRQCLQRYVG